MLELLSKYFFFKKEKGKKRSALLNGMMKLK